MKSPSSKPPEKLVHQTLELRIEAPLKFSSEHFEENKINDEDLIRLHPYGMTVAAEFQRPVLLMKDDSGKHVLPVAINPIEAGVTLSQSNPSISPVTMHKFSEVLMDSLSIKITRCVFVEIRGAHQFVRLYLENHPKYGSLKLKAEECMSLCLHMGVEFYATSQFMNKSKILTAESGQSQSLANVLAGIVKGDRYIQ